MEEEWKMSQEALMGEVVNRKERIDVYMYYSVVYVIKNWVEGLSLEAEAQPEALYQYIIIPQCTRNYKCLFYTYVNLHT